MVAKTEQVVKQCKYKLQNCCSNNQAEQIAILKTLEQLPKLDDPTCSKVTIDSLKNHSRHSFLIEEIRK
jgi:ribonuclease HI